jgi:hypothetical protein
MNRFYFSFNSGLCVLFAVAMSSLSTQVVAQESSHSAQASGEELAPALGMGVCLAMPEQQRMWMIRTMPGASDQIELKDCGRFNVVKTSKDCAADGQTFVISSQRFVKEVIDRMAQSVGFKNAADIQHADLDLAADKERVYKMRTFFTELKIFDDRLDAETRAEVDALIKSMR